MMKTTIEMVKYLSGWPGESGFGSRATADQVTPSLPGITAIITGATSGIGFETATVLAKRGVRLLLPARNIDSACATKDLIVSEFPEAQIIPMTLDLSSFRSIEKFVDDFISLGLPLNLLINNAGKYSEKYVLSEDGIEITFATNYLGHFLLTKLLLEKMMETAKESNIEGRIVNVTSNFHKWFTGDIFSYLAFVMKDKSKYNGGRTYALSKLATILHTKELALRIKEKNANVTVNCLNPGIAKTGLTRDRDGPIFDMIFFLASKLLKTIPQAAATSCFVATNPKLTGVSGRYFSDCNEASTSTIKKSDATRLWFVSEMLVSSTDPNSVFNEYI